MIKGFFKPCKKEQSQQETATLGEKQAKESLRRFNHALDELENILHGKSVSVARDED